MIRTSVLFAIAMATLYALVAGAIYLIRGPEGLAKAGGLSISKIILFYYAGAVVAGVVVGLLRPFAHDRDAAMGIGVIATFMIAVAYRFMTVGWFDRWTGREWFATIVVAVVLGSICGNTIWRQHHEKDAARRR